MSPSCKIFKFAYCSESWSWSMKHMMSQGAVWSHCDICRTIPHFLYQLSIWHTIWWYIHHDPVFPGGSMYIHNEWFHLESSLHMTHHGESNPWPMVPNHLAMSDDLQTLPTHYPYDSIVPGSNVHSGMSPTFISTGSRMSQHVHARYGEDAYHLTSNVLPNI